MLAPSENIAGARVSCTNPQCDCVLEIVVPCPHGNDYRCACGHELQSCAAQETTNAG